MQSVPSETTYVGKDCSLTRGNVRRLGLRQGLGLGFVLGLLLGSAIVGSALWRTGEVMAEVDPEWWNRLAETTGG